MNIHTKFLSRAAWTLPLVLISSVALSSSHMDAPSLTLDPAANTTDVYAFVSGSGEDRSLVVAFSVNPFEEPGIGPNSFMFDPNVLYEIHLALGDDVSAGRATMSYQVEFETNFTNPDTILQSYLGVVENVGGPNQNLTQTYTVTKVDRRGYGKGRWKGNGRSKVLGDGLVPPNNQGIATPYYNQADDGSQPAKGGVANVDALDRYTQQSIAELDNGYLAFAGQRDDGFYGDIQAIFDLLNLRNPGVDSQAGFNLHFIALSIPYSEFETDQQAVGVYATTSRRKISVLKHGSEKNNNGPWVQIGRQGNPLFAEGFIAVADKELYNRTSPEQDEELFEEYALSPELAALLNALVVPSTPLQPAVATNRTDLAAIFIPDLIKVDLSTPGVRLAGGGDLPDDDGFSRLSIFGGDVLQSQIADPFNNGGLIPGGWPNGRRFGDDVVDIGISAILSDLRTLPLFIQVAGDNVDSNDMSFNKVFPYEPTPQNGRVHDHHDSTP